MIGYSKNIQAASTAMFQYVTVFLCNGLLETVPNRMSFIKTCCHARSQKNAAQFFTLNDTISPVWDPYTDGNCNTSRPLGNPLPNPLFMQCLLMNSSDNISSMFDSCKWPIIKDLFNNIIAHGLEFGHTNLLTIVV